MRGFQLFAAVLLMAGSVVGGEPTDPWVFAVQAGYRDPFTVVPNPAAATEDAAKPPPPVVLESPTQPMTPAEIELAHMFFWTDASRPRLGRWLNVLVSIFSDPAHGTAWLKRLKFGPGLKRATPPKRGATFRMQLTGLIQGPEADRQKTLENLVLKLNDGFQTATDRFNPAFNAIVSPVRVLTTRNSGPLPMYVDWDRKSKMPPLYKDALEFELEIDFHVATEDLPKGKRPVDLNLRLPGRFDAAAFAEDLAKRAAKHGVKLEKHAAKAPPPALAMRRNVVGAQFKGGTIGLCKVINEIEELQPVLVAFETMEWMPFNHGIAIKPQEHEVAMDLVVFSCDAPGK